MKPENASRKLLSVTRSKAKMYEFDVPISFHIDLPGNPARLLRLTIGQLGDVASEVARSGVDVRVEGDLKEVVLFSAQFFDAYFQSQLDHTVDNYIQLVGSASYYLADYPGSSSVLVRTINELELDLDCEGLDRLLLRMLKGDSSGNERISSRIYAEELVKIENVFNRTYSGRLSIQDLTSAIGLLRQRAYDAGTPRQLLFADLCGAIAVKRFYNSAAYSLPNYSEIPAEAWWPLLQKPSFMRELWPSQHLLGRNGIFKGISGTVQMPTSAGKTKAAELVIRSGFLAGRTSLAIVVAPFRALCHEIKDSLAEGFIDEDVRIEEFTDVLQLDFELGEILGEKCVIVVTPEKLLYAFRQNPDLATRCGLYL
ncbi:MAG: DEAD/DEAH box helicase [Pyrinomonadaceae bacterium]